LYFILAHHSYQHATCHTIIFGVTFQEKKDKHQICHLRGRFLFRCVRGLYSAQ